MKRKSSNHRRRPRCVQSIPFVTCMCLTRNRRDWLPKAIQCFLNQTYPRKELLIVADGVDVRDLLPADDSSVRLIHLAQRISIGEKRNYACSRAAGSVICHWDDDDWSEADRVAEQVERLKERDVTGYCTMFFTDGGNWWMYTAPPSYAVGTSLCYRRSWWLRHPFQSVNVGEDNAFVLQAAAEQQLVSVPAQNRMHATIHSGNSSPRIYGSNWKQVLWATLQS
jgi:O-antigen biosynthesis protein